MPNVLHRMSVFQHNEQLIIIGKWYSGKTSASSSQGR